MENLEIFCYQQIVIKKPNNWSITCILFAPNPPQQNPVEDIWLQAKKFLRKYWYLCRSLNWSLD
jgi:transposase